MLTVIAIQGVVGLHSMLIPPGRPDAEEGVGPEQDVAMWDEYRDFVAICFVQYSEALWGSRFPEARLVEMVVMPLTCLSFLTVGYKIVPVRSNACNNLTRSVLYLSECSA